VNVANVVEGCVYRNEEGREVYRVQWVEEPDENDEVHVGVKFADGGNGVRVFGKDDEVPLSYQ
jgi:hypothetical protein